MIFNFYSNIYKIIKNVFHKKYFVGNQYLLYNQQLEFCGKFHNKTSSIVFQRSRNISDVVLL